MKPRRYAHNWGAMYELKPEDGTDAYYAATDVDPLLNELDELRAVLRPIVDQYYAKDYDPIVAAIERSELMARAKKLLGEKS